MEEHILYIIVPVALFRPHLECEENPHFLSRPLANQHEVLLCKFRLLAGLHNFGHKSADNLCRTVVLLPLEILEHQAIDVHARVHAALKEVPLDSVDLSQDALDNIFARRAK